MLNVVRIGLTTAIILCLHTLPSFGQPVSMPAPREDEVVVGPVDIINEVEGVKILIPVTTYFSAKTEGNALKVSARLFADLFDLQNKIGRIIDKQDLPRNNCRSYSANNPVVTVDTKRLSVAGNSAVLFVGGEVDLWDCRENPVPCTKVEWRNTGPFGTPSPTLKRWACNPPIKNKILEQPISMKLPLTLDKASATSVKLTMGKPDVSLGGHPALAAVRDLLLNIFQVDISNLADKNLRNAIDPNKLILSVPDEFERLNPIVDKVQFTNLAGHLGVELGLSATATAAAIREFLALVAEKKPN